MPFCCTENEGEPVFGEQAIVAFLVGDKASYISGETIYVAGGPPSSMIRGVSFRWSDWTGRELSLASALFEPQGLRMILPVVVQPSRASWASAAVSSG